MIDGRAGHNFCPKKLFRDDPETAEYLENLWLSWKMGQNPSHDQLWQMDASVAQDLKELIIYWEELEHYSEIKKISMIFGGSST